MTGSIGFYEPPPTDRELTAETVRDVVREQFPELAVAILERLGDGWEHDAYLVDDHVVFRFPRQAGGNYFEFEESVHSLVSSVIGDIVSIPRITRRAPPRFIHDDLQIEHVLVSLTTGRLSGIVDWCGGFGDPARDFSYVLLHGGWSFFQRAVDAYDLALDAEFAERTLFSARLGALGWLADAVKRGEGTSRHMPIVRRVFENGHTKATAA